MQIKFGGRSSDVSTRAGVARTTFGGHARKRQLVAYGIVVCAALMRSNDVAFADQTSAKDAKHARGALHVSVKLRALHMNREPYSNPAAAGVKSLPPNATGTNFGVALHAEYDASTRWSLGGTYYGAEPFSMNGPCSEVPNYDRGGSCTTALQQKYDPTLPVFPLSTLGEAYADYHAERFHARIGDQMIVTPWALPLDGRMKPVLFQGITTETRVAKNLVLTVDRILRFESRTSSAFLPTTFVTSPTQYVPGMLYSSLGYANRKSVTATLGLYNFYNIANLFYGETSAAIAPKSALAPVLSVQYVRELGAGRHYAGIIDNRTIGVKGEVRLGRNFAFSLATDSAPWRSQTVLAKSVAAAQAGFFSPIGGTPAVRLIAPGKYQVYYGGVASPYTGAYSGDALYTSFIPTNSMAQRQSAGNSDKITLLFHTNDARLQAQLAHADFDYSNGAGSETTRANYIDATYFFGPRVGPGFRGLSVRDRFSDRIQNNVKQYGGFPRFKYNMIYLEYNL